MPAPEPDPAAPTAPPVPEATATAAAAAVGRGTRLRPALLWSYVVSTGMYAITALMTFVLAAILGPEEFGLLWMALVWVTLAQILLQHGPTMAVIQHEHITGDHLDAAFWSTMVGAVLFTAAFAALAPLWAAFTGLPELTALCLALSPIVLLEAVSAIPEAVLRRQMKLRGIALRYLAAGLVAGLAGIACALAGLGVWALVVQQLGMMVLSTVLLWVMVRWRPRLHRFRREWREIRGTSAKTLVGALGDFLTMRADVLLMGALFGPVVVGLFRFAVRLPEMVVDLTARGLRNVTLPDLARLSDDPQAMAARLRRLLHAGAVLSIPALGVLAAAAGPVVLLIGEQWAHAVPALRLLCLASAVQIVSSLLVPTLQAAQRPGLPAAVTWLTAGCTAVAIYAAAVRSGGAGTPERLLTVAGAVLAVQVLLAVGLGCLTFGRVLRVSAWPVVRVLVPSALAAAAAAGTGTVVPAAVAGQELGPVPGLLLTATLAGLVAVVVLLGLDRQVRAWSRLGLVRAAGPA